MSQDLLTQLAEYGAYCEERQGTVDATDVIGPVVPIPTPVSSSRPVRGWLVAAAATLLVLLVVGGVSLLGLFRGNAPVVEEPTATTIPSEIDDTTVPDEGEPAEVTETTLASIPVPPPGEGPKLEFVQAELPEAVGHQLRDGYWFKGALYAFSWEALEQVEIMQYRSVDGSNWEVVPEFSPTDNWGWTTKTDGERLVNVAGGNPDGNCFASGASIQVNTSTDGVEWTSSEIPLPVPVTSSNTGCFNSYGADFAVGPRGIVVTTSIDLEIGGDSMSGLVDPHEVSGLVDPDQGIHVEVVDMDFERGVVTYRFIEEESGEVVDTVEFEVDGLGTSLGELLDAMEADPSWEPAIGPILQDMAENGDGTGHVSNGFAWFSVDGVSWEPIADVGPLQGPNNIASIVATADGFVATSEFSYGSVIQAGPGLDVLWHSVDGTTWTEGAGLVESHLVLGTGVLNPRGLDVWAGQPVSANHVRGIWTIEDSPRQLITAKAVFLMDFRFGELGYVGLRGGPAGAAAEEILFSSDGTTWNKWNPPEIDPEDGPLFAVGMGDDFFVMQQERTIWVGTLP